MWLQQEESRGDQREADRKPILLYYLAAAVVCLGLIVGFQQYTIRYRLAHQARDNMAGLAKSLSSGINEIIANKLDQFQRMAQDPLFTQGNVVEIAAFLQKLQSMQCPNTQLLFFASPDGTCISSRRTRSNISDHNFFRQALAGKKTVSEVRRSQVDDSWVITLALPVKVDGQVKGVFGGDLDIRAFTGSARTASFGKSGYACIVDSQGLLLCSPKPELVFNLRITDSGSESLDRLGQKILQEQSGFGRYRWDGVDKFASWSKVPTSGWTVVVTSPVEEFYGVSNSILYSVLAVTTGLFLLVILFGLIIMNRHRALERQRYLSYHDKLTGLYNRAYVEDVLKKLDNKESLPLSIILGDVDGLKAVNDTLGHANGDKMLVEIGGVLEQSCRKEDIVARWGGDEFLILAPKTDERTALKICDRILDNCRKASEKTIFKLSISLGAATRKDLETDVESVTKKAEERMYYWKSRKGDRRQSEFDLLNPLLWNRQPEDWGNFDRLKELTLELGKAAGLSEKDLTKLALLVLLHDIGQMVVPRSILAKPGALTAEEKALIQKHPEIGYRMAQLSPETQDIAREILAHHEWWDGSGYPMNLAGEEIPLLARIISITTAYNAMCSERPYRKPVSEAEALRELKSRAGTQFDPHLVQIFVSMMQRAS
ncbi:MAG: diguanylate cyclase [Firmicutes bacterium]|nr:diguanylate cyclase [Bacillota bacterium]